MSKQINRDGVVLFSLEYTLFNPNFQNESVRFTRVEHGLKLLSSCLEINHFAVIIAGAGESMRDRINRMVKKQTGMEPGVDFGVYLIPENEGKLSMSVSEHFEKTVGHWVDYCKSQNAAVTAGVASDPAFLDHMKEKEIRTVKCDNEATEVIEFRKLSPEEMEQHRAEMERTKDQPAFGGLASVQSVADQQFIDENEDLLIDPEDSEPVEPLPEMVGDLPPPRLDKRNRNDPSPDWQSDPIFEGDPAIEQAIQFPQYWKRLPIGWEFVDVYRVDELFPIELPGASRLYHARKKLMVPGVRTGGKSAYKDIQEAVATLQGWLRDHAPRNDA